MTHELLNFKEVTHFLFLDFDVHRHGKRVMFENFGRISANPARREPRSDISMSFNHLDFLTNQSIKKQPGQEDQFDRQHLRS